MKIHLSRIALLAILIATMFACKNSDLDLDKNLKFSKLSVEEQKQKIEQSGMDFLDRIKGIKNTTAFKTINDFTETSDFISAPQLHYLKSAMEGRDEKTLSRLEKQLKASTNDDDFWGIHEWNEAKGGFVKTSSSSMSSKDKEAVYKFPASETATTNNAVLSITYTESKVRMTGDFDDEYYPSEMTCTLKVDGKTVFSAKFEGSYDNDGTPTKVKSSMTMEDYSWNLTMKNDSKEYEHSYEYKYKKETLIKISASAKGDFTHDNIVYSEGPDDIFESASIYYQIMDIAILGGIKDVKAYITEMNNLDYSKTRAYYQSEIDIINKHLILYGYFVKDNTKFADVEFYINEYTDSYMDHQYNYNTKKWQYIEVTETYYDALPRFILSDGSKVDIEDYFSAGFDDMFENMDDIFEGIID